MFLRLSQATHGQSNFNLSLFAKDDKFLWYQTFRTFVIWQTEVKPCNISWLCIIFHASVHSHGSCTCLFSESKNSGINLFYKYTAGLHRQNAEYEDPFKVFSSHCLCKPDLFSSTSTLLLLKMMDLQR